MIIRRSTETDFDAIIEIYNNAKLDELIYESRTYTLLPLLQDNRRLQRLKSSDIYVLKNDHIDAYGAVVDREIRALYVHSNARGKGLGEQLLQYLIQRINGPATLCVAKSNLPAVTLYNKHGFVVVREFKSSYNGVPVQVNEMVRPPLL